MESITTLFLDLDNTIFPTRSINKEMLSPFLQIVREKGAHLTEKQLKMVEEELWEKSFVEVFEKFNFPPSSVQESLQALEEIDLSQKVRPYDDYPVIKSLHLDRYLITTSVTAFQRNKIDALDIKSDFKEIVIDDPLKGSGGKIAAFRYLMHSYAIKKEEILVVGDNPDAEIKAGNSLGIKTALIDRNKKYENRLNADYLIRTFDELPSIIQSVS